MIQRIDPIATSESIRETYLRYITTTFGLKNLELARQFHDLARKSEGLFKGPILEATPKYARDKSLRKLITEDHPVLSSQFLNYAPGLSESNVDECISLDRRLYTHQGRAIRRIVGQNRNVVVATGTGSGKTECFLIPIIDYLLKERSANRLGPGVRALLVYPMNALANDQVARLRQLLPPETGITFGRYTGQTKYTYRDGLDSFRQENNRIPQANELFCRDQILGKEPGSPQDWPYKGQRTLLGPPHILLTNFAMLEYLLMRPDDSLLFDGFHGETWRFIVLDEAHVYTGAQGTEISYLMHRLKDRVCRSQPGKLLCIATSATIGAKEDHSLNTIAASFENLFGEKFEKDDVITGEVVPWEEFVTGFPEWGEGSEDFYRNLWQIVGRQDLSKAELTRSIEQLFMKPRPIVGWPDSDTLGKALTALKSTGDRTGAIEKMLFYLLAGDRRIHRLVSRIEQGPTEIHDAAQDAWGFHGNYRNSDLDIEGAKRRLILLVDLASRARPASDSAALLSARYHFFVRSLEGLSITFAGSGEESGKSLHPQLLVGRHHEVPDAPGGPVVAFELQACGRCGQPFLKGCMTPLGQFISYPRRQKLDEQIRNSDYFAIDLESVVESEEDEEPLRDEEPPVSAFSEEEDGDPATSPGLTIHRTSLGDPQYICARCGTVTDTKDHACSHCMQKMGRVSYEWVQVRRVAPIHGGKVIGTCPACGGQKRNGVSIIRSFSPGDDAAGAVLAHCLLTKIPKTSEFSMGKEKETEESKPKGRFASLAPTGTAKKPAPGKRRLLTFSDSRQDAAFFATYMNRTANQILHRQLIFQAAKRFLSQTPGIREFDINDLINPLLAVSQEAGLFNSKDTEGTRKLEVSKWLNGELANIQRRQGLEGVGLILWDLKCSNRIRVFLKDYQDELKLEYGLSVEEFVLLLKILLSDLRRQNVLQPVNNVRIQDAYFWPRNRPYTIRPHLVNGKLSIASWYPQSTRNSRSDFIDRLFARSGVSTEKTTTGKLLKDLWELSLADGLDLWENVPSVINLWGGRGNAETAWRLRWDAWLGVLNDSNETPLYKCPSCGNTSQFNLRSVCPTYRCPGTLVEMNPMLEFGENHYRYLYTELEPISLLALEHTAQITTQEGAERQNNFIEDENPLNMLSCSTTFELGVDVGQLHSVFLRNVPPGVANYVQRAGRAGRRWSAAAYVLTFCRSRPHDLGFFSDVDKLISGKVSPPKIRSDNQRIARRHLHAVTLSHFWRLRHPEVFNGQSGKNRGTAEWFFFDPYTGTKKLFDWLERKPPELEKELTRIFSREMANDLSIDDWTWTSQLVSPPSEEVPEIWGGPLGLAQAELLSEHKAYQDLKESKPVLFSYAEKQIKRLRERQLLGFLASRNVLPKYGFPVDVVPLKVESKEEWAQRIELDRDLKIALSEYAPGCTLVANGKVIRSYALEKVTGKAWPEYRFVVCGQCGRFHRSKTVEEAILGHCECGQMLDDSGEHELEGKIIEPIYGFRTFLEEDGQEPVEVRPQRSYSSRVYFSHYRVAPPVVFTQEGAPNPLSGIQIMKRYSRYGALTIINSGKQKRGFWICPYCGFGDLVASARPEKHKTPWGSPCKGNPKRACLGHEFQSDVLELRFQGSFAEMNSQGFWFSLTAALLAGAAKALDIERDDIDGTVLQFGGPEHRSIVLFDSVPGGAGHVHRISENFRRVMDAALEITDCCTGCSRDQSCNACLRNYRNQYAHDIMSRGAVADFLRKAVTWLYQQNADGFIALGLSDPWQWLQQQMRRANRFDLNLEETLLVGSDSSRSHHLYRLLYDACLKGIPVHLFLRDFRNKMLNNDALLKASLHKLTLLSSFPNAKIVLTDGSQAMPASLYVETDSESMAFRWPAGTHSLEKLYQIELSTFSEYTEKVRCLFDDEIRLGSDRLWDYNKYEKFLQGTKVIQLPEGDRKSWRDLLADHLPPSITHVEIYDRYLRNRYQFTSLSMFLDVLVEKMAQEGMTVEVTTTSEKPEAVQYQFKSIQEKFALKKMKVRYKIHEPDEELPHYRKVLIRSKDKKISIWLDRGLDIYRFEDLTKPTYKTLESYIVIEGSTSSTP